jgi:hypothetical protein
MPPNHLHAILQVCTDVQSDNKPLLDFATNPKKISALNTNPATSNVILAQNIDISWLNWPLGVSLLISALAFIVAAASFYFNSLMGPRIYLINHPEFVMVTKLHEGSHDIKDALDFDADFVLSNIGPHPGVVRLKVKLQPATDIQPFCLGSDTFQKIENTPSNKLLQNEYFLIERRSNEIISTRTYLRLREWKRTIEIPPEDSDNICDALARVDTRNKEQLKKFCQVLKEGNNLAAVSVEAIQLLWRWRWWRQHFGLSLDGTNHLVSKPYWQDK